MPALPPEKLTRREREIMDAIFALGDRASAEEIRTRLTDPPSYSAVRAMLVKLEAKGYIKHHEEGLRYVYTPTMSRATARRAALRQLVRVFFDGSPGQAAAALLKQEAWTDDELEALRREIDQARTDRRQS
jgi:BlaI family transcriptional regulator, penicillinase repressor